MNDGFYRVVLPYAVYGVEFREGRVMTAPPIARWALGMDVLMFASWVTRKGGTVEMVGEQLSL